MGETRRGVLLVVAAYTLWGLFPLYWPLLEPSGALEILGHRIVWSLVVMLVLVLLTRRSSGLLALISDRRVRLLLAAAAVLVTFNWGTYIWGVNHGHVVETALGYFILPLVSVVLGVVVLGERLSRLQWVAIGFATLAVLVLSVDFGRPPFVALVLAFSFGGYGLLKKQADSGAVETLAFETMVVAPLALGFLLWLGASGGSHLTGHGTTHVALLVGTGVITAVPLLFFGGAATRIPLSTLGLLQYIGPIIQLGIGVLLRHEATSPATWVGFALVWVALVVFTLDSLGNRRRPLCQAVEPVPV